MHPKARPLRRIGRPTDIGSGAQGGREQMEHISDYEWFCANCLRMVEALSRHGRCPFCDSNAVDVAYRWHRPISSGDGAEVAVIGQPLIAVHG